MKNLLESFAILLVGLLSVLILFLIVKYNMIEDDTLDEIVYDVPKKEDKKSKTTNYLKNLEGYEDVNVTVDATRENSVNTVSVVSEEGTNAIDAAVDDKAKTSYMENLSNYEKNKNKVVKKPIHVKKVQPLTVEPQKLKYDVIVDDIGMAIEDALSDL